VKERAPMAEFRLAERSERNSLYHLREAQALLKRAIDRTQRAYNALSDEQRLRVNRTAQNG
jgi:hypothetical protein